MLCCAIILVVLSGIRLGWRAITLRGGKPDPVFPPPATRQGPGSAPPVATVAAVRPSAARAVRRRRSALLGAAIGIAGYAVAVDMLLYIGVAHSTGDTTAWLTRNALLAAVAVGLVVAARAWSSSETGTPPGSSLSRGLIGAGWAVFALGIVDMHVFALLSVAHGNLFWGLLFHGLGPALVLGGLLIRRPLVHRTRILTRSNS